MYVISIVSTKGGVGKTSLAANVSALLADLGARVLMIDADQQASLSKYYNLDHAAEFGLCEMIRLGEVNPSMVSRTSIENLSIVLSNDTSGEIAIQLPQRLDRAGRVKWALNNAYVYDNFDIVIIDTQGARSPLQEACALAADLLVSPIVPDIISAREFVTGTVDMLNNLEQGRSIQLTPPNMVAVINRMDQTKNSKQIAKEINQSFLELGGKVRMLKTVIRNAKAYPEAATMMMPVHCVEVLTPYKSESAYQTMHRLVWELVPQFNETVSTCFGNLNIEDLPEFEMLQDADEVSDGQ